LSLNPTDYAGFFAAFFCIVFYIYTSIKSGYTARIKVDPHGIVIDYENEWQLH